MQSIGQRVRNISTDLSKPTDSDVVHLRTLRAAIGFLGLALPWTLALGENIRDRYLSAGAEAGRWYIEGSISAYYHTGMREVFVAILAALGIFLLCYKGPEWWDVIAAKLAGAAAILVALLPTHEHSREATDTGERLPDSVTLFSGPDALDPEVIGTLHYVSAALFFVTVALMALFLFTKTRSAAPTGRKRLRNLVYRVSGLTILVAIAAIAVDKLLMGSRWSDGTSFVFWMETVAVTAFGAAWLTKAEVVLKDRPSEVAAAVGVAGGRLRGFSLLGLLLAALGVYAVVAFSVERRTQELGIRAALGASAASIMRMVVGQSFATVLIGIVAGLALAFVAVRGMQGMLFGVGAADPATFVSASVLLLAAATLAAFLPARQAARADPVEALRSR